MDFDQELWSNDPKTRMRAASRLANDPKSHKALSEWLAEGAPETPWPYGMPTSVNPYLLILGLSPGGSPDKSDRKQLTKRQTEIPTIGASHPGLFYEDTAKFWLKIRALSTIFMNEFWQLPSVPSLTLGTRI